MMISIYAHVQDLDKTKVPYGAISKGLIGDSAAFPLDSTISSMTFEILFTDDRTCVTMTLDLLGEPGDKSGGLVHRAIRAMTERYERRKPAKSEE